MQYNSGTLLVRNILHEQIRVLVLRKKSAYIADLHKNKNAQMVAHDPTSSCCWA